MQDDVAAAVEGHLENRAEDAGATHGGRPEECAIGALDQAGPRKRSVRSTVSELRRTV